MDKVTKCKLCGRDSADENCQDCRNLHAVMGKVKSALAKLEDLEVVEKEAKAATDKQHKIVWNFQEQVDVALRGYLK